jgi:phospholipase C
MAELTRRRLLGSVAGALGGSAALALLPPSVQKAVAAGPPRRSSISDVEHVVLLMQENRSFDHYFGTLSGVRGFSDPAALQLSTGRSVFYQPDPENPNGYLLPFHLDTRTTSAQAIPSTSHAWSVQHKAWNDGAMDNWLPAHRAADGANGPYVMGYYTRDDIPFQFALAETFTVCDNYFCSVFGPTWPNRLYWMTGTIDPGGADGGPVISNSAPQPFTWTTYAERLQAAGISWKVYQQTDDYGCNMLETFANFQNAASGSALYEQGMRPQPEGTFEDDARNDRLPTVSWIIPTSTQSEHPDYLPAAGADYVAQKLEAIASNPAVWAKTAFILNYDENDGLFDHVPPPVPPPDTPGEYVEGLPIGAGFRVPAIIVSPWTVGGWVASERFDHTSPLRFLERFTGIQEPNISTWRRSTFGDMTSAFRFTEPEAVPPPLPDDTGEQLKEAEREVATLPKPTLPGADQTAPVQEPGTRPRL